MAALFARALKSASAALLTATLLLAGGAPSLADARAPRPAETNFLGDTIAVAELPPEGRRTLAAIQAGGPFPYAKDGAVFGNFEKRLPRQPRGYYREYTVDTPGARNRGARRIIAGEGPRRDVRTSGEYYYSDDHYRSFRLIRH